MALMSKGAAVVMVLLATLSVHAAGEDVAKVFDSLYGKEKAQARQTPDPSDDVQLAARLLDAARTSSSNPELATLLTQNAYELALVDASGYETAATALGMMINASPDQSMALMGKLVDVRLKQYNGAPPDKKQQTGQTYLQSLISYGDAQADADDNTAALTTYRRAMGIARGVGVDPKAEIVPRVARATAMEATFKKIKLYKQKLQANPQDADAASQLLLAYIVDLDRPEEARKYTFTAQDQTLKTNVGLAGRPADQLKPEELLQLADWYTQLADGVAADDPKSAMLTHANVYYTMYLEKHEGTDLDRTRVTLAQKKVADEMASIESRLAETRQATKTKLGGDWIDALALVNLNSHAARGHWEAKNGMYACDATSDARLDIPILPDGSYEVRVRLVRNGGAAEIGINLPIGPNKVVTFVVQGLKGEASGLARVNGRMYDDNVTTVRRSMLPMKSPVEVFARVKIDGDKVSIFGAIGSNTRVDWSGSMNELSSYYSWEPSPKCLGVVADYGIVVVTGADLRMLDGKAYKPGYSEFDRREIKPESKK
ncbi:MAG: hypothetical protein GC162_15605 [Planctomycetes bacterium]|nr:hypothetical protein [Planctomycetota bacterium]